MQTARRISSALCRSCDFLADELQRLRTLLDVEVRENRWYGSNIAVEYSRVVNRDADATHLYVHCEPAWGETNEEYETRYLRVIALEKDRLRHRRPRAAINVARRDPDIGGDLFMERLT